MAGTIKTRIVLRNDTAENWSTANPTLLKGEVGIETDTNKMKVGDGVTPYNDLVYTNELDASDLTIGKNLTFTYAFGKYQPDSSGSVTIESEDMSLAQLLESAFAEEKQPSITQPSATISCPQAKAYEVGTKVTPTYTTSFKAGSYQYGPATGITADSYSVTDGVTEEPQTGVTGTFPEVTVTDGMNYKLTATVHHTAGAKPLTNLGNPATSDGIAAGNVTANSGSITGYRAWFFGTSSSDITLDSASIRGLTNKGACSAGAKNDLVIPEGTIAVVIAVPQGRSVTKVADDNAFGTDIFSSFVKSEVQVEGANGYTAQTYQVYKYVSSVALAANTYDVTIA